VSVEAISWALNLAPVPADRGGQPSSPCKFVLAGLANHAGPDGTGAFPSVATLVRYTGLSERTVRTCLDRLEADGIIRPCDPDIIAARIKRADRRPKGWDLDLSLVRDDLDEPGAAAPDSQSPIRRAGPDAVRRPDHDGHSNGVQSPHPAARPVDNAACEVQQSHPAPRSGCSQRTDGVQPAQPPGCSSCTRTVHRTIPGTARRLCACARACASARACACACAPADARAATSGGGPAGEFFTALGADWRLTGRQRARLTPAVAAALDAGWTPRALAAFTGANTGGVRSPYAVLAARLSPAELPVPPARSARAPWCGECDEVTRMLDFDSDAPRPCPRCKPAA
jgi:hypothetical protein